MAEQNNKIVDNKRDVGVMFLHLPSPELLAEYEKLSPGTTKQLLRMAQVEQKHRHAWEDAYLIRQIKNYRTGQLFGFITALIIVILSSILAIMEREAAAAIVAIPGLFMLVMVTIINYVPLKHKSIPRRKN